MLVNTAKERKIRRKSATSTSVGNGQIIMNSHQQMIPVQIPAPLNYQYEDRDTGQPVIVSADGQQIYVDSSQQVI